MIQIKVAITRVEAVSVEAAEMALVEIVVDSAEAAVSEEASEEAVVASEGVVVASVEVTDRPVKQPCSSMVFPRVPQKKK